MWQPDLQTLDLEDFYKWEAEILRIDRRFRSHVGYVQELNNTAKRQAETDQDSSFKRQWIPDRYPSSSNPANPATGSNAISNKENERSTMSQSSFHVPCPKLTDDEHLILKVYNKAIINRLANRKLTG